jgi:hypothetical protein
MTGDYTLETRFQLQGYKYSFSVPGEMMLGGFSSTFYVDSAKLLSVLRWGVSKVCRFMYD